MKNDLPIIKLVRCANKMVNNSRRYFLKQGIVLVYGTLVTSCGSGGKTSAKDNDNQIPVITVQPVDVVLFSGESATFQVAVDGVAPLTYQWRRDGVNISGATSSSYTTPELDVVDNASVYSVEVVKSTGLIVSRGAVVTVIELPTQVKTTVDRTTITIDSTHITVDAV